MKPIIGNETNNLQINDLENISNFLHCVKILLTTQYFISIFFHLTIFR